MIVVVGADAKNLREIVGADSPDFEVSTSVPAAIELLDRTSPDRPLLATVVSKLEELHTLVRSIGNVEAQNLVVLLSASSQSETIAQALMHVLGA